ncbi:zinc transporter 7 [Folsomia candida]|uniref:zinc transporter 7 n=1 Tax=Folsomia candida TaxID=158441 RepID=UPI000B8F0EF9|nr:zinc transporter 7 [Folsomia candida]
MKGILVLLGVLVYQGTACSSHWGYTDYGGHGVHSHSSYRASATHHHASGPGHIHGGGGALQHGHIHQPGGMRHGMMESALANLERGRASHGHGHGHGHHGGGGGHRHSSHHHHTSHHHHK